jgi:hypothetical protein
MTAYETVVEMGKKMETVMVVHLVASMEQRRDEMLVELTVD